MNTPIFIPSKGRAYSIKTHTHFDMNDPNLFVVVELEDYADYLNSLGEGMKILVLPKSNQGIVYVRNWILEFAKGPYWMLDDDISAFAGYSPLGRVPLKGREALNRAEQLFKESPYPIAQGALEYDQFAWSQKKPLSLAGYCDVAVWMNPQQIRSIRYRTDLIGKEDRHFTLTLLTKGLMTAKASMIGFRCPSNGSNAGGLSEIYYKAGKDTEAAHALAAAFPNLVTVVTKPSGRIDAKINWAAFKPKKLK